MKSATKRLLGALAIGLVVWSCGKDNPVDGGSTETDTAPATLTLSPTSFTAGQEGGPFEWTVTAPSRPKVSCDASWVKVTDGTYKDYRITFTLTVEANGTYDSRTATLTVTAGSLSQTAALTQAGREKITPPETDLTKTLVTAGATVPAQNLFNYLLSIYGQKTLSGVIADVNWNHREADKIRQLTGRYPAINCYDFIQVYVPEGNGWIDYSDLTPVTEWSDGGGIVSLMWHFNVPKTASTTIGTDGSGVTCTPSETSFRAKNVFTEGSWENQWFYAQMDKVVSILLQLQEKGIAALWRPFHEGAGNACAINQASWTNAWFWWGYDGADVYKQLWTTMFDYFASRGVKNLIWVWTTQNYNGDPATYKQDTDWYPGEAYVDIVGRDLYGYTDTQNATEFTEIQAAYPKKMVALAECGVNGSTAFSEVGDFWTAGAHWSWFMPWYGSSMPADAWWKNAMDQNIVITRDQLPSLK